MFKRSAKAAAIPAPADGQPVDLSVHHVSKTFGKRPVVRDVSMHVRSSEAVGLLMIPKTLAYVWVVWMGYQNFLERSRGTAGG